jgi:hypothetical protein
MKSYLVVLDGTSISWQAAYSAFHLAARLGSQLIGLAAHRPAGEAAAKRWLAEFETGARAAGIAVESRLVTDLEPEAIAAQAQATDGVFWGWPSEDSAEQLPALMEALTCALWLVPRQTSVRRVAHLVSDRTLPAQAHFVDLLARRLGVELVDLPLVGLDCESDQAAMGDISRKLKETGADLLVFGRGDSAVPVKPLCRFPPCLLLVLPS